MTWLPQVRNGQGKNFLQRQGEIREFRFELGKIDVFERSQEKVKF